ncbi:unannotated protein [freshwater metagenome]|uniref:Unannotated protein n=1 Tax=freshwater metagenome TaxID=449393 RepID=A0A6J6THY1_9ZZZZ
MIIAPFEPSMLSALSIAFVLPTAATVYCKPLGQIFRVASNTSSFIGFTVCVAPNDFAISKAASDVSIAMIG